MSILELAAGNEENFNGRVIKEDYVESQIILIVVYDISIKEVPYKDVLVMYQARLEQESGIFLNLNHFVEKVIAGEWEDLEKYLLGFTKMDENRFSIKIFSELRMLKYLEALDRNEREKAFGILRGDLDVFSLYDDGMYKELSHLMTLENFSANMQHLLCENWRVFPEIKTLLTDHECKTVNMASTFSDVPAETVVNRNAFSALGMDKYFLNSGASTSINCVASLLEPAIATPTCMLFISNQGGP